MRGTGVEATLGDLHDWPGIEPGSGQLAPTMQDEKRGIEFLAILYQSAGGQSV